MRHPMVTPPRPGVMVLRLGLALGLALAACGGRSGGPAGPPRVALEGGDAPYDLAEDQDLELIEDELAALDPDDPARLAQRRRVVDERIRRAGRALAGKDLSGAHEEIEALLRLFSPAEIADPARISADLGRHRAALDRARAAFSRAGKDREAALVLAALVLVAEAGGDAALAASHRTELQEIFDYGDDLAVAAHGEGSERARPIEILEHVVDALPVAWAVDRLVVLYRERQAALDSHFRRTGADLSIIRAHGDGVVRTTWHIVRVLARAGRIGEAEAALEEVHGIGDDSELRERLRRALSAEATAPDWVMLAARYHSGDPDKGDLRAALALTREAIRRFPSSPTAHLAAAESARQLGDTQLAIRLYEAGLALEPSHGDAASQLAELYLTRIGRLTQTDRPRAAGEVLRRFDAFHRRAREATGGPVEPDRADALATMGRGLVSLGELEAARAHLERSLAERETVDALESLGTMALKQERHEQAIELFSRALATEAEEPMARYHQCRVLRLLGEAHLAAGQEERAASRLRAAMVAWNRLGKDVQMPPPLLAEALAEQGKILWQLGERETALTAFEAAVDSDPDGASIHADVVAFLIVRGQYDEALDAYHRALGSRAIDDYFKVYMSLWVLAEARRQGRPEDPVARDFLAGRDGTLWYDDLARFAGGRLDRATLEARATTRGRRAELLYYSAVLGGDLAADRARARQLLEEVLATDMVLFFEYDMARHWLTHGFGGE